MNTQAKRFMVCSIFSVAVAGIAAAQVGRPRGAPPPPPQIGTYTTASGTISQFNYGPDAEIEGFLLSSNTLVHLPPRAASAISAAVHSGDAVQVSGLLQTSPSGLRTMEAQAVKDQTSGKAFTIPQPGAAAPYSGSGRIRQLNYGPDGAVNGFMLDNGTLAAVPPFAPDNPTSIRAGAAVSYSGYAHATISGRTVVDVQTLSVNGQTIAMTRPAGPPPLRPGPVPPPPAPPAVR